MKITITLPKKENKFFNGILEQVSGIEDDKKVDEICKDNNCVGTDDYFKRFTLNGKEYSILA